MKKIRKALVGLIFIVSIITTYNLIKSQEEKQSEQRANSYEAQNLSTDTETLNVKIQEEDITQEDQLTKNEETKVYPKEEIIEEYKGYTVCAKLEIPSIELETYVLKNYSIQALNISVTKFWGVNPNETGNCCIAGHNFKNKNMFRNLKKLKIGDKLTISDNKIGKVEYEIFDIYTVVPEDTSCLEPETEGEKEVTLITCTSDSKKRIIVKAKDSSPNEV